MIKLFKGDCLELMKSIPDKSIDAIITDPPYGTTACKWDSVIPFDLMWGQLNRIIKDNGAIVLFGSEPFSSALRMSNIKNYKYDWIWKKTMCTGMAQNEYMPMKYHEIISVFVNKSKPTFNKILSDRNKSSISRANYKMQGSSHLSNHINIGKQEAKQYNPNKVNPKSILEFKSVPNTPKGSKLHPTQKPVDLVEYLIKTYTNENETVLDFTMGSGTTGVACKNLNRNFIGIEMDDKYFSIAENRINNHIVTKELF
jgi:site-specific DNA-methyltransferase (adenine-specific)